LFEGFQSTFIDTAEATIRVRYGGKGTPLLLLHGHPQTHAMWNKIAPRLAEDFTVVAADLRGYGQSSKPPSTADHQPYSKRAMAQDQIEVMRQLGFDRFFLAGHDRGGRVAYRLALDHPEAVIKLAVLDIIPTGEQFRRMNMDIAYDAWHWLFLAQPYDLPERLIEANPDYFYWQRHGPEPYPFFTPEAFEDYRRAFTNPATIHAMCEDYRAGATVDFALDEADRGKKRITCPLLVLWSNNDLGKYYDVLAVWRDWARDVRGREIESGHYLAEEAPDQTYTELHNFFLSHFPSEVETWSLSTT
jgi:haloacetate dehalogenase